MALEKLIAKSKTTEVDATTKLLILAFEKQDWSSDPHLTKIFDGIKKASQNLTAAIKRNKSESTLEEKDAKRDDSVRALFYLVQSYLLHPDNTIKAAAAVIMSTLDKYGKSMVSESYAVESSLIESLLVDLTDENNANQIPQLPGLSELISALTTVQSDFEKERLGYQKEKAEESVNLSASKIKQEVLHEVNGKLVVYLRAMMVVDEPTFGAFARTTAEIIANNNRGVKKRQAN